MTTNTSSPTGLSPQPLYAQRLHALRGALAANQLDALLVTKDVNRYYFSQFRGSAGALLISQDQAVIITDSRFTEQAAAEATTGFEGFEFRGPWSKAVNELVPQQQDRVLAVEDRQLSWQAAMDLQQHTQFTLHGAGSLVDDQRFVKDEYEKQCLRRSAEITVAGLKYLRDEVLGAGVSENDVELALTIFMREQGAEAVKPEMIVASGPRGALPHGTATSRKLAGGDFITLDVGCIYQGYYSDITRTFAIGKVDDEQRQLYQLVHQAQLHTLAQVQAGLSGQAMDAAGRGIIEAGGYGPCFTHSIGHGVGLELHERPFTGASSTDTLAAGVTVTVEPGVYRPGWGGVRIEDTVIVSEDGCEVISSGIDKELVEI